MSAHLEVDFRYTLYKRKSAQIIFRGEVLLKFMGRKHIQGSSLEEQYDKIYRYCYYKLQQRETAEDITQETFLRYLNHQRYQSIGQAMPYLYTIARNLCIDEYRRQKQLPFCPYMEEFTDKVCLDERMFSAIAMKIALAKLDEEEREMILLRYVNEVPLNVISQMFGFSRFAVYRKLTKALKKLEGMLREENSRKGE